MLTKTKYLIKIFSCHYILEIPFQDFIDLLITNHLLFLADSAINYYVTCLSILQKYQILLHHTNALEHFLFSGRYIQYSDPSIIRIIVVILSMTISSTTRLLLLNRWEILQLLRSIEFTINVDILL